MAYISNGKVFTDHALMDEVVYHVKIILKDIVLKNESKANDAETKKFKVPATTFTFEFEEDGEDQVVYTEPENETVLCVLPTFFV